MIATKATPEGRSRRLHKTLDNQDGNSVANNLTPAACMGVPQKP